MNISAAVVPISLLLLTAFEPPKQTAPTYLESLEVSVANLDVVVTDHADRVVHGLRRDDFEVRENGAPQEVTNFSEFGTSSGTAELSSQSTTAAPAPAIETPPARKFVFYVDDLSMHPQARAKLSMAAHKLIETQMRPGDEAMVVTPENATLGTLAFTTDRAKIDAQLQKLIDHATFRADTPARSEEFFYDKVVRGAGGASYRSAARIYATKVNRRVTSTLRALLGVVGSLTQTEGKKVLVVLTESLTSQPGREAFTLSSMLAANADNVSPDEFSGRNVFETSTSNSDWFDARPMIEELGARATANGITIYTIQPDPGFSIGVPGLSAGQGAPKLSPSGALSGRVLPPTAQISIQADTVSPYQREIAEGTAASLTALADATGGKFWSGEGEIRTAFETIASDVDSYYSIGYRVSAKSDNTIHNIDVSVKNRPDLKVRTRREVMRYSPDREMGEIAAAALLTAKNINELGISATAAPPRRGHDAYAVDVSVKIPLENLTFIPNGDHYEAQIAVHYAAADGANYSTGQVRRELLRVPAKEIDTIRAKNYTYTSTLMVSPGTARISVGVFDQLSRLAGFQRLSVEAR